MKKIIFVNITTHVFYCGYTESVTVAETMSFEKTNMQMLGNYLGMLYTHLLHFPLFSMPRFFNAKAREKGK